MPPESPVASLCTAFPLDYNGKAASCDADTVKKQKQNMSKRNVNGEFKASTGRFGTTSEQEKQSILRERNSVNTNKATSSAVCCIEQYLQEKGHVKLDLLPTEDLPNILEDFYINARTQKGNDLYHVQTMKCMRAGLNRYLQEK